MLKFKLTVVGKRGLHRHCRQTMELEVKIKKKILVGDVDFQKILPKVKAVTPVPGGVGPMTIHCLLQNTFDLALKRRKLKLV